MKKLKLLTEQAGLTQTEITRRSGVNQTTLSKIFNGIRELTDEHAFLILTKALDYKASEAKRTLAQWRIEELSEQAGIDIPDGAMVDLEGFKSIPLLTEASCGEGTDIETLIEDINESVFVPDSYVKRKDKTFAFKAVGDSMVPDINNGDVVVVEHTKEIEPYTIQLVRLEGKLLFGKVHKTASGYEIEKSNRSISAIKIRQDSDFSICGTVVGVVHFKNMRIN